MDTHELNILVAAGIYPAPDNHKRALDGAWGFMTMVETIMDGNKRWTMHEIIHGYCLTSFNEDIEDEPEFVNHTIARVFTHLIMDGHKRFKAAPPRPFLPIYKYVMSDEWWDASDRKVRRYVYNICEIFDMTPYQYTNKKGETNHA
jgi:hypothetical protein